MKKTLLSLILLFTLLGCGAKDSVKEQISDTETTDVTTFVKEMDGVSGSISRLLKSVLGDEKVEDFYTKYYNPFMQEINKELGRSTYDNDAYFKFDKYGNVLEVGVKIRDNTSDFIHRLTFKPTENNIPIFMYDWESMTKYIKSQKYGNIYTQDYNGVTSKYYSFQSDSERVAFEIKDGEYTDITANSNNDYIDAIKYDNQGRMSEIFVGKTPYIRLREGSINYYFVNNFVDDDNNIITYSEQINEENVNKYSELKLVFDYGNNKVKLYNGSIYLGVAKDTSIAWENNQFKMDLFKNVWVGGEEKQINDYVYIDFDNAKRIIHFDKKAFDYTARKLLQENGSWVYDNKYGVLKNNAIYFDGLLIQEYSVEYELANGLIKKFISTELYNDKKYNKTTNSWEIIEEEPTIVTMDYTRNPSNNKITSVYTNINLGNGININGVFKPKK